MNIFFKKLVAFGWLQFRAVIFGFLLILAIIFSNYVNIPGLYRYDFLFIIAVLIQLFLILKKYEHPREIFVIALFHIVATGMEIFKTSPGIASWAYQETSIIKIANVPLFAGFMYSSVGSYIARIWRLMDLKFSNYPSLIYTYVLVGLIYINFFTHHYIYDIRIFLFIAIVCLFRKTTVSFKVGNSIYTWRLIFGFLCVTLFIWIAENISTFWNVWTYPNQKLAWEIVSFGKFGSWFLLIILSFVLVSIVYRKSISAK